jgi:hypothetical protein
MIELNPFKRHFWGHIWGPWSKPKPAEITYVWGNTVDCLVQERTCKVCGKVEIQSL